MVSILKIFVHLNGPGSCDGEQGSLLSKDSYPSKHDRQLLVTQFDETLNQKKKADIALGHRGSHCRKAYKSTSAYK